jgi:hypothetical protein
MGKESSPKQLDRRSGRDRRQFTFTLHIPEHRSGKDRRRPVVQKKSNTVSPNDTLKKVDSETAENA